MEEELLMKNVPEIEKKPSSGRGKKAFESVGVGTSFYYNDD